MSLLWRLFADCISFLIRMAREEGPMITRLTLHTGANSLGEIEKLLKHQSAGREGVTIDVAQIERALSNPHFYLYVAEVECNGEKRYAGMASVFIQHNVVRTIAEVHDVVSSPEFRRQGFARKLMEKIHATVQTYADEFQQPIKIYLTSRPERVEANLLYQKLGYTLVARAAGEWGTNLYNMVISPR